MNVDDFYNYLDGEYMDQKVTALQKSYNQALVTKQAKLHGYGVTCKTLDNGEISMMLTPSTIQTYNYQAISSKKAD